MNAKQAREQTDKSIAKNYNVSAYIEEIEISINRVSNECDDRINYNASNNNLRSFMDRRFVYEYKLDIL